MKNGQKFWNNEYAKPGHLALSTKPSEDLEKCCRWLTRRDDVEQLGPKSSVVDLGCGNGRNLIFLAKEFGVSGFGVDISSEAIRQANENSKTIGLDLQFKTASIVEPLPVENESQTLVLDMMVSHVLTGAERERLIDEIYRVLMPGGMLLFKTFLLDEDENAKRLLSDFPGEEAGTYIHPEFKVAEHVFTESEINELLKDRFIVRKSVKSFRHRGRAAKRRSITVYAQKT
jgi:SAM-dependent methyltransferase